MTPENNSKGKEILFTREADSEYEMNFEDKQDGADSRPS